MKDKEKNLKAARFIAFEKLKLLRHVLIYIFVLICLIVVNKFILGGDQWWPWVAIGWGIGVFSHFLTVYLLRTGNLLKRVARREAKKFKEKEK